MFMVTYCLIAPGECTLSEASGKGHEQKMIMVENEAYAYAVNLSYTYATAVCARY